MPNDAPSSAESCNPLGDQKILVTGAAGQIGFPLAEHLATTNEVWGLARFSDGAARDRLDVAGIHPVRCDLAEGDFRDLPDDFDYVLHLAVKQGPGTDTDDSLRVNAEGTGLLMAHCHAAKAFLVMSTFSVYEPNPDRLHAFAETDQIGDTRQPFSPTYSVSKIGQEAVARTMARVLKLPTTIARMNASYGPNGGLPAMHLDWLRSGQQIVLREPGPSPYSPIHQDDINTQAAALLQAAAVPATVVNWAGDEVVTAEDWIEELAALTGLEPDLVKLPFPNNLIGSASDSSKRQAITGPCSVNWKSGMARLVAERVENA